ncbi:hypothetical protein QOT17_013330 [Balamuthia mandrillaris]
MFGSGKTAMGRHLCEAFARELDADPEFKAEVIQSYGEPVKMLCQARYVLLDFTDFVPTEGLEKSLYWFIFKTLWAALSLGSPWAAYEAFNKLPSLDLDVLLPTWKRRKNRAPKSPRSQPFFFYILMRFVVRFSRLPAFPTILTFVPPDWGTGAKQI